VSLEAGAKYNFFSISQVFWKFFWKLFPFFLIAPYSAPPLTQLSKNLLLSVGRITTCFISQIYFYL
jgi:hypothetical protein